MIKKKTVKDAIYVEQHSAPSRTHLECPHTIAQLVIILFVKIVQVKKIKKLLEYVIIVSLVNKIINLLCFIRS
jgi:hypothetical protein